MPRESFYDEVEIEDFKWDPQANVYHYPCPCGDRFEISKSQLRDGDEVARCPSCSLIVRVVYEWDDYEDYDSGEEQDVENDASAETDEEDRVDDDASPETDVLSQASPSAQVAAAVAAQANGMPTTLLGKLDLGTRSDMDEKQLDDKGADGVKLGLPSEEENGTALEEKHEDKRDSQPGGISEFVTGPEGPEDKTKPKPRTGSLSAPGGQRSPSPPPRSPNRVEVELE